MAGLEFCGEALWKLLTDNGISCPDNVKDILRNTNYDNMCLLANFKPTVDLASITTFYRDTLHLLIDETDKERFYGLYKNNPKLFALQGGISKAILCVVEECKRIMRKRQAPQTQDTPSTKVRRTTEHPTSEADAGDKPIDEITKYKELLERNINLYCLNTVPEICPDHHYRAVAKVASVGHGMYSAKVECLSPSCEFIGLVNMNKARNWNTSNFQKHLRRHLKDLPKDQKPVTNFFPKVNPAPLVDYNSDEDKEDEPETTDLTHSGNEDGGAAGNITDSEEESVSDKVIPIAWVLMENKSQAGYSAVFRLLKHLCPNLNPERIISDWELGQQQAWQDAFPNATIQGCLWHLSRAFVRKAQSFRLLRFRRVYPQIMDFIRKACIISLLPERLFDESLAVLMERARGIHLISAYLLRHFFNYIQTKWLQNPYRRNYMNFYRCLIRTNNSSESHNRQLRKAVGAYRPNVYAFIEAIARLEHTAYLDYLHMRGGGDAKASRRWKSVYTDNQLNALCDDLERDIFYNRDETIWNFLDRGSHLIQGAFEEHVQNIGGRRQPGARQPRARQPRARR